MPQFSTQKTMNQPLDLLFNLVLDIEKYPQFIPWCQAARIISHDVQKQEIVAELTLQFKTFTVSYKSLVNYNMETDNCYIIAVKAISGPFKYLHNDWKFYKSSNKNIVEFDIDFKLKSPLFNKLVEMFFYQASSRMIEVFSTRAAVLHS